MKKKLLAAVMLCTMGLAGCGDETENPPNSNPYPYDSQAEIMAHLEGKSLVSKGASLASHPVGANEDQNLGDVKVCYTQVELKVGGGKFTVTSTLGTLENAPKLYDIGNCNHDVASGGLLGPYESTSVTLTNIKQDASCFDIDIAYTSFAHSGRGKLSADGKTLTLELFVKDKASGIRCADGEVGAKTVKFPTANGPIDFAGNAQQVYTVP